LWQKLRRQKMSKKKSILLVIVLISCICSSAEAKWVYAITDHGYRADNPPPAKITSYDINGTAIEPNTVYTSIFETGAYHGPVDVAVDANERYLFVSHENKGDPAIIELLDARSMVYEASVLPPNAINLAGIVFDNEKNKLYAAERDSLKIFVYSWDPNCKTLFLDREVIIIDQSCQCELCGLTACDLALDEKEDLLYVTFIRDHSAATNVVYCYNTNDWTFQKRIEINVNDTPYHAVSVAVLNNGLDKYLFTGAYLAHNYLIRTYLMNTNDPNSYIKNDIGASATGIAVDQETGLVYVTASDNTIKVFDGLNWPSAACDVNGANIYGPAGICMGSAPPPCWLELTKVDDINDCVGSGDEITYTICYNYGDANCCPGSDFDGDCFVDFNDFAMFANAWQSQIGDANWNATYDISIPADGVINNADLAVFCDNWLIGSINDVNIIDELPDEVDFNSADSNGVYDPCTHTVTWNIGTLKPGDANRITLKVNVKLCVEQGSTITNICKLKSGDEVLRSSYEDTPVCCGCPIYVDVNATGCNNGYSWKDAYNYLQDALEDANTSTTCCCDEIWVADGTYKPDQNSVNPGGTKNRTATFQLINGITIKGGYAGYGAPNPNERNVKLYETILSGDLLGNDRTEVSDPCELLNDPCRAENSYHVVTGNDTDANAILDGFTITAGDANSDSWPPCGGGMYNQNGSPTVKNCTFRWNSARGYYYPGCHGGGGMYNAGGGSPMITDCNFIENWSQYGGGMSNSGGSQTITNCTFTGNSADSGGGMYGSGYETITNCVFTGNSAQGGGGGIGGGGTVTNCTLTGNSAQSGGGIYGGAITNCTLTGNSAQSGGGIYGGTVTSCILWDNSPDQIAGGATVSYSDVEGGWPGCGNIDEDPCLAADGYHLTPDSPCIDAGDPLHVAGLDETDIDGQPRIMDGNCDFILTVDMGADEFPGPPYLVVDDFESYTDPEYVCCWYWIDSNITEVWHSTGGADVNISTGPCDPCLPYQRHTGAKAMAYFYNNSAAPFYSEAYANTNGPNSLDIGTDWTIEGIKSLSIWFHGIGDLRGRFIGLDPYEITADGSGLKGAPCGKDSFYYVHRKVNTNRGQVTARVDSVECGMAGVMMRQSLACNSKYAAVYVTACNKLIYQQRRNDFNSYSTTISGITFPHWVKIGYANNVWIAEHSSNGSTWTAITAIPPYVSYQLNLSTPIYLGLCVSSNSYGDMCTAEISNVTMQAPLGTGVGDPCDGNDICIDYNPNDPTPMYVVLQDSDSNAIWYYPGTINPAEADANVTQTDVWAQWLIDLNDFTDVNLTDVQKLYIGFGNRVQDGNGLMYIDDIYLLGPCH
jgi:hypothetical protein